MNDYKFINSKLCPLLNKLPESFYNKNYGSAYLGDSLELLPLITSNSVNLILTSPPFALIRKKEYGNKDSDEYIEWFLPFAEEIYRVLTPDGSFVLDLGGAYLPGYPIRSIYQFELLIRLCKELNFKLAQEFYHYNPSKLPAPAEWVNIRRIRVKDSVNVVWWLCKSNFPKADNKKILKPYSNSMLNLLKKGYKAKLRPSGHDISDNFNKNNNGAIPSNLLELANTESNSSYLCNCRNARIKPHPARFPTDFADFFIRFLTDKEDIVLDPFCGSNSTGFVAENLFRYWIAFEKEKSYLEGSKFRFK